MSTSLKFLTIALVLGVTACGVALAAAESGATVSLSFFDSITIEEGSAAVQPLKGELAKTADAAPAPLEHVPAREEILNVPGTAGKPAIHEVSHASADTGSAAVKSAEKAPASASNAFSLPDLARLAESNSRPASSDPLANPFSLEGVPVPRRKDVPAKSAATPAPEAAPAAPLEKAHSDAPTAQRQNSAKDDAKPAPAESVPAGEAGGLGETPSMLYHPFTREGIRNETGPAKELGAVESAGETAIGGSGADSSAREEASEEAHGEAPAGLAPQSGAPEAGHAPAAELVGEGHAPAAGHEAGHAAGGHEEHAEGHHNNPDVSKGINLLILIAVLYFLLATPVKNALADRTRAISEELASARTARETAEAELKKALEQLDSAERSMGQTLAEGREQAENEAAEILNQAKADAVRIEQNAQRRIADETEKARQELKEYVVKLASEQALKVLGAKMTPEVQDSLINSIDLQHKREGKS